jgi:TRAP-type C4-dicarboxylate transport system permease large subunit
MLFSAPKSFGLMMVVNLPLAPPPSGATLFVSTAIAQERLDRLASLSFRLRGSQS